jgi:hypothetical protein
MDGIFDVASVGNPLRSTAGWCWLTPTRRPAQETADRPDGHLEH